MIQKGKELGTLREKSSYESCSFDHASGRVGEKEGRSPDSILQKSLLRFSVFCEGDPPEREPHCLWMTVGEDYLAPLPSFLFLPAPPFFLFSPLSFSFLFLFSRLHLLFCFSIFQETHRIFLFFHLKCYYFSSILLVFFALRHRPIQAFEKSSVTKSLRRLSIYLDYNIYRRS